MVKQPDSRIARGTKEPACGLGFAAMVNVVAFSPTVAPADRAVVIA